MCGIAGYLAQYSVDPDQGALVLHSMNARQRHRGPDGEGIWQDDTGHVGLAHLRLSIIDLTPGAAQPMQGENGTVITFNGEIYNFIELRQELGGPDAFRTTSDTEVILRAYERWGESCVEKLRGMFAFAIWDVEKQKLFVARDRFGIKPFYYFIQNGIFFFASEIKALLPFKNQVKTNLDGLRDYFTFQFCLGEKTLFDGINRLLPAHCGYVDSQMNFQPRKYWEVHYDLDWNHTEKYFVEKLQHALQDSINVHLRSDVEVGAYVSGGLDSSLVASMARDLAPTERFQGFTGKFSFSREFDESEYARALAEEKNLLLHERDICEQDFMNHIAEVIYHLDEPVAGPGSFPQFLVSQLVRDRGIKVVLGGQGGDEIFGGYTRYLIAYFEQCIKGAIDGTMNSGNFIVTYESIIPNLKSLQNYKPLIQEFFAEGIFDSHDKRYFRLINRSNTFGNIVDWGIFNGSSSLEDFQKIFWGDNVGKESYFDSMTHFDFKTLLPSLLQVEDRMSMAHSIESRVPFLDHRLVEIAASIPADIKFKNGELKRLLKISFQDRIPGRIFNRKDKMGFPVPLQRWLKTNPELKSFVLDLFKTQEAKSRPYLAKDFDVERLIETEGQFTRNLWSLLCLELWQKQFHDQHQHIALESKPILVKA